MVYEALCSLTEESSTAWFQEPRGEAGEVWSEHDLENCPPAPPTMLHTPENADSRPE